MIRFLYLENLIKLYLTLYENTKITNNIYI